MTYAKDQEIIILIPVHNRRETTLSCLRSLYADSALQSWPGLSIVVIDDGSTDGTAAAIRSAFSTVTVLSGDGHLWWTGAIRQGMEYAYSRGCEGVFWLNDDCPPTPGSLAQMYSTSISHGNAIIGAACRIAETGMLQPVGAQGKTRIAAHPGELLPVDEMSGHCVHIPKAVIDKVGFPDAYRFPHYHGDSSYILRATRTGFRAYILGDATVSHSGVIKARLEDFSELGKDTPLQSLKKVFLDQKSLYYLPTQFFYNIEKYGNFRGTGLFFLKLCHWLIKWGWLTSTSMQL